MLGERLRKWLSILTAVTLVGAFLVALAPYLYLSSMSQIGRTIGQEGDFRGQAYREKLQNPRCDDSMKSTSVFKAGEPRHSSSLIFCVSLNSLEDSSR